MSKLLPNTLVRSITIPARNRLQARAAPFLQFLSRVFRVMDQEVRAARQLHQPRIDLLAIGTIIFLRRLPRPLSMGRANNMATCST
jgi:hypothetical protein